MGFTFFTELSVFTFLFGHVSRYKSCHFKFFSDFLYVTNRSLLPKYITKLLSCRFWVKLKTTSLWQNRKNWSQNFVTCEHKTSPHLCQLQWYISHHTKGPKVWVYNRLQIVLRNNIESLQKTFLHHTVTHEKLIKYKIFVKYYAYNQVFKVNSVCYCMLAVLDNRMFTIIVTIILFNYSVSIKSWWVFNIVFLLNS